MKAADLSHATVDWDSHFIWSCKVTSEFYQQVSVLILTCTSVCLMFTFRLYSIAEIDYVCAAKARDCVTARLFELVSSAL